jgi:toxin ParE1/3/4
MNPFRIEAGASHQIDEIHAYARKIWGQAQADRTLYGLFDLFEAIAERRILWRPVPAQFGVTGYFCRYEKLLFTGEYSAMALSASRRSFTSACIR